MTLHLQQPKLLLQLLQQRKSPITVATEEINAKANTPVVPADKAKTGDIIAVDVKKTGPSAKTDGADTTTTSTATIKTTSLADQNTPVGTSKPVSSTKTATSTKETADYTETTTETVNKTTVVEVTKEADVVNKKKFKEHPTSSLSLINQLRWIHISMIQ